MKTPSAASGIYVNARLATMVGGNYGLVENGVLAWQNGIIAYVGCDLAQARALCNGDILDAYGALITPALIDCHTHLVFAGNRAHEFEMRLNGASYQDITRAGGGIVSSVRALRECSEQQLFEQSLPRAQTLLNEGVATLEIKSGYGLDLASERKMLRVARRLGSELGITVKTTYLAAHALPPEYAERADDYIEAVCQWLPVLHAEGLVDAVDVFCEGIGFSTAQSRRVFQAAHALGLPVKAHADQLSNLSGAALVAEFGGLSADHVEYTDAQAVHAMKAAGTVAVLLPGAFHCLRETQLPPIDLFRTHGVPMAVSTDLNPGTSPVNSLLLAMSLACTHFRLTPEEALRGATQHAAKALGLNDRGILAPGLRADFCLWQAQHPAELSYWLGTNWLKRLHIA